MKTYPCFENQVLLYAKGWYGTSEADSSEEAVMNDLMALLNRYTGGCAERSGVHMFIVAAFNKYVTKESQKSEGLLEALGWHWGRKSTLVYDRCPEVALLGKLSVAEGEHVKFNERYDDIFFGNDKEKERIGKLVDEHNERELTEA